jgi:hypothetical protein
MYQMHRVFCATPWELEGEQHAFYDVIGGLNEREGIPRGVLFVPVTLGDIRDKRRHQFTVDENIRDCSHYILLLYQDWGPPERNFENDYLLALQCVGDSALPMQSVTVLQKRQLSGKPLADGLPEPQAVFSTTEEFGHCLNSLLSAWLDLASPR